jgi:glycosyltransferase involved in cell wall biosynthesis
MRPAPLRVVYHHRTAGRGGEGAHLTSVINALTARGHEVTLISPPGVNPFAAQDAAPLDKGASKVRGITRVWKSISCHAPQWLFELLELGYNAFAIPRLVIALRRQSDAYVYERYANFLFAGALVGRWMGRSVLLEVNEVVGVRRARGLTFTRLAKRIERYVFSRVDQLMVVSSHLRDRAIESGARPASVHVFPNAIDARRFASGAIAPIDGLRRSPDEVLLGFLGWFDQWDRLDVMIEATSVLRGEGWPVRCVLVGDGPVAEPLRRLVAERRLGDAVLMTGAVPRKQVARYIQAIDVCVLPDSNTFGSPLVLFEFMAAAKAIVAADVPPIRDVIEHGRTGVIVPRADVDRLVEALRPLVRDSAQRIDLGSRARAQVLARHTWDATAARVEDLVRGARKAVA